MSKRTLGYAFPTTIYRTPLGAAGAASGGPPMPYTHNGMTLRDYFAAAALKGIMSLAMGDAKQAAFIAYGIADAMLAERERE